MIPDALAGVGEDQSAGRRFEGLARIFIAARPFENIAAVDLLALQVSGLAGHAAQFVKAVVIGFELVIGDGPVLDRHIGGNDLRAITLRDFPPAADRKRRLVRMVAERDRVDRVVDHQFHPRPIFQLVANARQDEFLLRLAVGTALQADDVEARKSEFLREDGAGQAHAHHHRIDFFEFRDHLGSPQLKSAMDCGSATT